MYDLWTIYRRIDKEQRMNRGGIEDAQRMMKT
jgi:hypothetical protein